MVDFVGIVCRMVETLEVRDRSRVKGLVELGGVVEAGKEVEVDEVVVVQDEVLAGKEFEEVLQVLEIDDRFDAERLVEVVFEEELDVGKMVKLDEVVEVREGVEVGQGLEEKLDLS